MAWELTISPEHFDRLTAFMDMDNCFVIDSIISHRGQISTSDPRPYIQVLNALSVPFRYITPLEFSF